MIRKCQISDISFLVMLMHKHYAKQIKTDSETLEGAFFNMINLPDEYAIWLTEKSALVAHLAYSFYDPFNPVLDIPIFAGRAWDLISMFKVAEEWAISMGCKSISFGSSTGYDIEPMAHRIGFSKSFPCYIKEI